MTVYHSSRNKRVQKEEAGHAPQQVEEAESTISRSQTESVLVHVLNAIDVVVNMITK